MGIRVNPQRNRHYQNIIAYAKEMRRKNPDSIGLVPYDWSTLWILCGSSLYKWEQNASGKKQPLTRVDSLLLVLILPNLIFLGADKHAIT